MYEATVVMNYVLNVECSVMTWLA